MHMRGLVLCAATVTLIITSASATMRIADDSRWSDRSKSQDFIPTL
jgi:hypothetical protein